MKLTTIQRSETTPEAARKRCDESGQLLTLTIQAGETTPEKPWMDAADYVHVLTPAGEILQTLKRLV